MLRGFFKLTLLEIKIFIREPLGVIGTVGVPVAMFLLLGRSLGSGDNRSERAVRFLGQDLPIFVSIFIALSAAISLVAVISIYREGGILKRLRATPLRPTTILAAHVMVKLLFTGLTLALMVLAGRRIYPAPIHLDMLMFSLALLVSTLAVLSMGFVIASLVPTARFAQPIGSALLYPMLAFSGIFMPLDAMPRPWAALGKVLPVTHAVSLLRGAWMGAGWLELLPHLGVLALTIAICLAISSRAFRWE